MLSGLFRKTRSPDEGDKQRIVKAMDDYPDKHKQFKGNAIRTSKYSVHTFFVLNLWEQFQRLANVYFLAISILQFLPVSSMTPTSWLPLVFVLVVNMVKELIEDTRRKKMDKEVNCRTVHRINANGKSEIQWKDVVVGDVLWLQDDQPLPADIIVLTTSDNQSGLCYIETANLDGETNLKNKESVEITHKTLHQNTGTNLEDAPSNPGLMFLNQIYIQCEKPNPNLHSFSGNLIDKSNNRTAGITNKQVIYRGCTLRNTKWIYGIVIFTGMETKLMMNATEKRFKRTTLDKLTNKYLIGVFLLLGFLCVVGGVLSGIWVVQHNKPNQFDVRGPWYLHDIGGFWPHGFMNMVTWIILLNTLIPISLTVSMEMIKVGHAYFINRDINMCYEDPDSGLITPARARTSNLSEDLGRIEYIFSDKTGTLTQNVMEFMKCAIDGQPYGTGTTEIGRAAAKREGRVLADEDRPADLQLEKGDNFYDSRVSLGAWKKQPNSEAIRQFFIHLAVCHKVMAKPKTGDPADPNSWSRTNLSYQASSPDEEALVLGAKGSGFWYKRRSYNDVVLEIDGQEQVYEVLNVNEFDSTRKRMSTVVRTPDGQLLLLCKGADNVMYERLADASKHREETKNCLRVFANEGLRTLVLGRKSLTEQEYAVWNQKYVTAFTSTTNRDDLLDDVAEDIEKELILCGASAIEDKLQDGVPNCIKQLADANIQIWVLTGDKVETAINIAMACNLIDVTMHNEKVTLPDLPHVNPHNESEVAAMHSERKESVLNQLKAAIERRDAGKIPQTDMALVIDGYSLEYAIAHEDGEKTPGLLLQFSAKCKAVVCCRVSPKQKADVVELMRIKRNVITLAIGDGANDVGMIMKAHIGVGISGKEGVQAVMASDYSIAQFRYLQQLVLIHGRWDFQRISLVILFFFYKNIAFAMVIYWFAIYNGFSGTAFWDDMFQAVWNVFFTSVPILAVALFNKDMKFQSTLHHFPYLYYDVQCGKDFTATRFILWMADALWCSTVCFFVPRFTLHPAVTDAAGLVYGRWFFSFTCFASVHLACNLRLTLNTRTWPWPTVVLTLLSIVSYFIFGLVFTNLPITFSKEAWLMMAVTLSKPAFWHCIVLSVILSVTPAFVVLATRTAFRPDDTTRMALWEHQVTTHKVTCGGVREKPISTEQEMHDYLTTIGDHREKDSLNLSHSTNNSPNAKLVHDKYEDGDSIDNHYPEHGAVLKDAQGNAEEFVGFAFSIEPHGDPEVPNNAYIPNPKIVPKTTVYQPELPHGISHAHNANAYASPTKTANGPTTPKPFNTVNVNVNELHVHKNMVNLKGFTPSPITPPIVPMQSPHLTSLHRSVVDPYYDRHRHHEFDSIITASRESTPRNMFYSGSVGYPPTTTTSTPHLRSVHENPTHTTTVERNAGEEIYDYDDAVAYHKQRDRERHPQPKNHPTPGRYPNTTTTSSRHTPPPSHYPPNRQPREFSNSGYYRNKDDESTESYTDDNVYNDTTSNYGYTNPNTYHNPQQYHHYSSHLTPHTASSRHTNFPNNPYSYYAY